MSVHDEKRLSRRQMVNVMGAGLATVAAGTIPAYPQNAMAQNATAHAVENPTTKYPRPPFKVQTQPWPGLAMKMDPP